MVHNIAELLGFLGLPRVAAITLAVLLSEHTGLTLSELSQKTGYAKSHLSTYLKTLVANGLVEYMYSGKRILYRAKKQGIIELLKNYLKTLKSMLDIASNTLHDQELHSYLRRLSNRISQVVKELEGEYSG